MSCGLAAAAAAATRMRAGHQTFASFLFSCCFVSCTRTATAREAPSGWEAARLMTGYACALCHCGRSFDLSEVARLQPTPPAFYNYGRQCVAAHPPLSVRTACTHARVRGRVASQSP